MKISNKMRQGAMQEVYIWCPNGKRWRNAIYWRYRLCLWY